MATESKPRRGRSTGARISHRHLTRLGRVRGRRGGRGGHGRSQCGQRGGDVYGPDLAQRDRCEVPNDTPQRRLTPHHDCECDASRGENAIRAT